MCGPWVPMKRSHEGIYTLCHRELEGVLNTAGLTARGEAFITYNIAWCCIQHAAPVRVYRIVLSAELVILHRTAHHPCTLTCLHYYNRKSICKDGVFIHWITKGGV